MLESQFFTIDWTDEFCYRIYSKQENNELANNSATQLKDLHKLLSIILHK